MSDVLDLRSVLCPSNYVHLRLALEKLAEGDELEVLLPDGKPVRNVPRSLKDDGDQIVALKAEDGHYRMRVKKGGGVRAW